MRILICSIGTGGDVNPYVALALALKARGHEPVLLLNPHFAGRARGAGLEVVTVGEEAAYLAAVKSPELIHATRGPQFVMRELIEMQAPSLYQACRKVIRERRIDVVVRHFIAFGAGWATEQEGIPHVVGVLTPMFWFSNTDPSTLTPSIDNMPKWMVRLLVRIQRFTGRFIFDRPTNRARKLLGLPPIRNALRREFLGGDLNLGLWSPHFRGPVDDDPAHGKICGFTWFDRQDATPTLAPELERFVSAGDAPIVFTLGTSVVHHAGSFYDIAADAARKLNRRAVLLTGSDGPPPTGLPPSIGAFPYAPFSALLPRASCVVHHGGIGTTAQAMRAGTPTVIIPFANDEFDNASRARKLGVSVSLQLRRLNPSSLAAALDQALNTPGLRHAASLLGTRLADENGATVAVQAIEALRAAKPACKAEKRAMV